MTIPVLDDFDSGMRTTGGHDLWELYTGEGASGSTSIAVGSGRFGGDALQLSLSGGRLYLHLNDNNGSEWAFAHEKLISGSWTDDTYNRLVMWVKHPTEQPSATATNRHLVELGTYVRCSSCDRATQNDGGTHYYHYYNPRPNVWTRMLLDWHPQHYVGGPTSDPGVSQYPTSSGAGWNYMDALTRLYWNIPYEDPTSYPAVFLWDGMEFYNDTQANEDLTNIASLEASYNVGTNLLHLGFVRNSADDTTYTVKYASSDIHVLGFANATELGTSGVDGQGDYVTKKVEGTVDLSGQATVFLAVQKSGNSTFRQIELPLTAGGGGVALRRGTASLR